MPKRERRNHRRCRRRRSAPTIGGDRDKGRPSSRKLSTATQRPALKCRRVSSAACNVADDNGRQFSREAQGRPAACVCHYEPPHSTGRKDLSRLPLVLRRHRSIITQRHRDVQTISQNTNHPKISDGMCNILKI